MPLRPGKLPPNLLREIILSLPQPDPRVRLGPGVGRDAAVIELADRCLIVKTDPVTFATDQIGWYAVHINANDVACMGAQPLYFMLTSMLPAGCDESLPRTIVAQVLEACTVLGVAFLGGHTEMTNGIDRPLVTGVMIGEVACEALIRPERARAGDAILLTKGIPIEGTTLIAREMASDLAARGLDPALVARATGLLREPGISVVREARIAASAGATILHDPTEGGLATAIWELCESSGLGAAIQRERIPIVPEGKALCEAYGLDPMGVIASGALLIGIGSEAAGALRQAINDAGIQCEQIGHFVSMERGVRLDDAPMPRFDADEITKIFL
jgi:hydrogenase expression/formation protein HypE